MSTGESLESIMRKARELEKNYDWMGSVGLYRTALSMVSEQDILKTGEVHEWIGYGFFMAATQADSLEEFKKRMRMSVESYEEAAKLFENVEPARGLYCRAMAKYSHSWFVEDPSRKRELLDDCWRLMKEALEGFDATGDQVGYGEAFRGLSFCLWDRYGWTGDWHERTRIAKVINYGQTAVAKLSEAGDLNELVWAYTMTSFLMAIHVDLFEEGKKEIVSVISNFFEKALEISGKIGDAYLLFFLYYALSYANLYVLGDWQAGLKYGEKCFQQSEKSHDHFLRGLIEASWSWVITDEAITVEDPEKRKEKLKIAMQLAEESIQHCLLVCRYDIVSGGYSSFVENRCYLAELETSLERKRALLKQAVESGRKGSEYAKLSCALDAA